MKQLRISIDGRVYDVQVEVIGEESPPGRPAVSRARSAVSVAPPVAAKESPAVAAGGGPGDVPSPLAGLVVSVDVQVGQEVGVGDKLLTLEAMKMNTVVSAPAAGKVASIHVAQGDAVEEGQPLVTVS